MARKRKGTSLVSQQKRLLRQLETLSHAVSVMEADMTKELAHTPALKAKGVASSLTAKLSSIKQSFKGRSRHKQRGSGLFSKRMATRETVEIKK